MSVLLTNIDDEKNRIADINKTANESYETETNLQTVLIDAKSTLKRLDEQSDFIMTVLAAENDDRSAFEKLGKFGNDPNYSFHDQALKSMETIIGKYFGDNSETDKAWRNLGWINSVRIG